MLPLFVYGTMRDPEVLSLVLGRPEGAVEREGAWLQGARLARVSDETYPMLVSDPGASVEGELLVGLSGADRARIRFFEGDEYAVDEARIRTHSAATVAAELFVLTGTANAAEPWSLETWQRDHRAGFLPMARDFMALYGRASPEAAEALWSRLAEGRR